MNIKKKILRKKNDKEIKSSVKTNNIFTKDDTDEIIIKKNKIDIPDGIIIKNGINADGVATNDDEVGILRNVIIKDDIHKDGNDKKENNKITAGNMPQTEESVIKDRNFNIIDVTMPDQIGQEFIIKDGNLNANFENNRKLREFSNNSLNAVKGIDEEINDLV